MFTVHIDSDSVSATKQNLNNRASKEQLNKFKCKQCIVFDLSGNILDHKSSDIVFSQGVLHHTGDIENAILKATYFVSDHGKLVISLYYIISGLQ